MNSKRLWMLVFGTILLGFLLGVGGGSVRAGKPIYCSYKVVGVWTWDFSTVPPTLVQESHTLDGKTFCCSCPYHEGDLGPCAAGNRKDHISILMPDVHYALAGDLCGNRFCDEECTDSDGLTLWENDSCDS